MREIWLLLLVACGPNLTGSWSGSLTAVDGCSNAGGNFNSGGVTTWGITQNGNALTIDVIGGNCGLYSAQSRGSCVWEVQPVTCPPPSGATSFAVKGGTVVLTDSGALDVFLTAEIDGMGLTCLGDTGGRLVRQ